MDPFRSAPACTKLLLFFLDSVWKDRRVQAISSIVFSRVAVSSAMLYAAFCHGVALLTMRFEHLQKPKEGTR